MIYYYNSIALALIIVVSVSAIFTTIIIYSLVRRVGISMRNSRYEQNQIHYFVEEAASMIDEFYKKNTEMENVANKEVIS